MAGKEVSTLFVGFYSPQFLFLLCISLFIGVVERLAMLMLRMRKHAARFSTMRVMAAVINFVVIYLYATNIKKDFLAIVYGNVISLLLTAIIATILIRKTLSFKTIEWDLVKEMLRYGFPFVPTFLVLWVFEGIDKIMLRHYSNFYQIGVFAAAYKIVAILSILQTAFSTFWAPVAFEMYEKKSEESTQTFAKVFSYMSAIIFICGLGLLLSKDVVIILFEKSYHEASSIMPFLLLIPIMYTLSEVTVGGINYASKTYWHLIIAVCAAATNLSLNFILVPGLGAKGAAISTGIAYVVFFYLRTYLSNRLFKIEINFLKLHTSTIIFLAVAATNTFYPKHWLNYVLTAFSIVILIVAYSSELLYFKQSMTQRFHRKYSPV